MTDMTAFEHRVADAMVRRAGPVRPVDDVAIFESVAGASRQKGWGFTMSSALKFIAAGVVVALFGGFLVGGVLITQQGDEVVPGAVTSSPAPEATSEATESPTTATRTEILPGVELTVEGVEPGVFHILNDGVRDLELGGNTDIVAGHDDGIWLLRKNRFFRLGSGAEHAWPTAGGAYHAAFEVMPDGTVLVIHTEEALLEDDYNPGTLFASDGDGWTPSQSPPGTVFTIEVATDGTLWASWTGGGYSGIGHLGSSGWLPLEGQGSWGDHVEAARLYPTDSGDLYAMDCGFGCWFVRYQDGAWELFPESFGLFDVAPDGTAWFLGPLGDLSGHAADDGLARFADGEWAWWEPIDLPDMGLGLGLDGVGLDIVYAFATAPDGSLWTSQWRSGTGGETSPAGGLWTEEQRGNAGRYDPECDGLVRFDGVATDHFLPDQCISMDIAADGSVWVLADGENGKHLYVITSEAFAATE